MLQSPQDDTQPDPSATPLNRLLETLSHPPPTLNPSESVHDLLVLRPELPCQPPITPLLAGDVFCFDKPSLSLKCRFPSCVQMATSNQPGTTICPRCGIYAYTRYCSVNHLLGDLRRHLLVECGRLAIPSAIDESTIGNPIGPKRHFVFEISDRVLRQYTTHVLERHRQAMHRCMKPDIDYFIFNDLDLISAATAEMMADASIEVQNVHLNHVRGNGIIYASVSLPTPDVRKLYLNDCIDQCLSFGLAAGREKQFECMTLYVLVVEDLVRHRIWNARMCDKVVLQMAFEFGWRVPEQLKFNQEEYDRVTWNTRSE